MNITYLAIFFNLYLFFITVPSSIQPIQDPAPETEGSNVTLFCNASGIPSPTVSWIKVSGGQRTDGNILLLTNISRNEAGEYRCEASSECGNASETVNIVVHRK